MAKDIIYDANGLVIEGGDFKIGESINQDIERILTLNKGEVRTDPLIGVGMVKRLNGPIDALELDLDIRKNLRRDGIKVDSLRVYDDGEIRIKGSKNDS